MTTHRTPLVLTLDDLKVAIDLWEDGLANVSRTLHDVAYGATPDLIRQLDFNRRRNCGALLSAAIENRVTTSYVKEAQYLVAGERVLTGASVHEDPYLDVVHHWQPPFMPTTTHVKLGCVWFATRDQFDKPQQAMCEATHEWLCV